MSENTEFFAKIGERVNDRYTIVRFLGTGAVGMVFLAEDRDLGGLPVALKFLFPHLLINQVSLERFRSEVLIVRELHHPNIVKVFDFGRTEGNQYFLVMEYIDGTTLASALASSENQRLPLKTAVSVLYEVASGMQHAHQRGVIHRDLKPQNVLVTPSGRICVCDFGLARRLESADGLTRTGESVGTPHYMAPELFRGEEADERTDVYAIGILAYEILAGRKPFVHDAFYALAMKHLEEPMPSLSAELHLPSWVHDFVVCATAKARENRYASAKVVAELLEPHLDQAAREQKTQLFQHWTQHEERRVRLERKRKRRFVLFLTLLMVCTTLLIMGFISRTNSRFNWWLSTHLLIAERELGPLVVSPMKRLLGVDVEFSEKELRDIVELLLLDVERSHHELAQITFRLEALLGAGINANATDENGVPLIMKFVEAKDLERAVKFLETGRVNPNIRDSAGNPLLHMFIKRRLLALQVSIMLSGGVDPSLLDPGGNTAFHAAIETQDFACFLPFLTIDAWKKPAILNAKNTAGYTALGMALLTKGYSADRLLDLIKVSDVNLRMVDGKTALILAAEQNRADVIRFLLTHGAKLEERDDSGNTALYYASRQDSDLTLSQFAVLIFADRVLALIDELPEEKRQGFRESLLVLRGRRNRGGEVT